MYRLFRYPLPSILPLAINSRGGFIAIKLSIVHFLETETLVPYLGGKAFRFPVVKTNIFLNLMAMAGGVTKVHWLPHVLAGRGNARNSYSSKSRVRLSTVISLPNSGCFRKSSSSLFTRKSAGKTVV